MKKSNNPVNIALPNTVKEKMTAIVALAHAIENISEALISAQVEIEIKHNTISNAEIGINISTEGKAKYTLE